MFDWIWSLLYKLGFWKKKATILLLGLDNAGKTTLLHRLKYGSIRLVIPTQRAQLEEIFLGNVKFRAWDLGGHEQVRSLWKEFFFEADAVIFIVDSADRERLPESKKELLSLIEDPNLAKSPFLILSNKTDLETSIPYSELVNELGLSGLIPENENEAELISQLKGIRSIKLFPCSLVEGTGYSQAFQWLSDIL